MPNVVLLLEGITSLTLKKKDHHFKIDLVFFVRKLKSNHL